MDRTKEYSFVLSTMPRLHARSRLLELGVHGSSRFLIHSLFRLLYEYGNAWCRGPHTTPLALEINHILVRHQESTHKDNHFAILLRFYF